ncbi:FtsX-like permease family protein [Caproiciproducens sp. CPB-2]|uniref:FtsX-like permease family protein n=1 Tax=Caproiciproducens sp. CPB-2 TaxID=3030017 RepID=UPI0023DAAC37|nr:FtsX-like permease family protein [Caproiciproducens sp. CPB-2]MDF1495548.1 FtsX-like permease family protein [Caproiciproducens sp. CPB-2]
MFSKLAFKNVTKSIRDFTVYFLTLTFGVSLFYVFNSIDSQTALLEVSKAQARIIASLITTIDYVSVFISIILGFLVVYANQFLIKRRKKELAVYMTLGMAKGKISRILILETMIIGVFSLAVGLLVGVFASQWLSVVTAKLFEVDMKAFLFTFSTHAFYKTVLYFGIIFLIVIVFNTIAVSRYKLIDLLNASKKNQKLRFTHLWISVILFLVALVCILTAYHLIIDNGMMEVNSEFTAAIVLGSIGTLLFFMSLSGFLLRVVKANKKLYLKNLNMFVLRQINSKINTTFVSMSVICIMLLVTIGTLSTGIGLSDVLSKDLKGATPYDATYTYYYSYGEDELKRNALADDIAGQMIAHGVDLDGLTRSYAQMTAYYTDHLKYSELFLPGAPSQGKLMEQSKDAAVVCVSQSDYNAAAKLQGRPTVSLRDDEFLINCSYVDMKPVIEYFLNHKDTVVLNGKTLKAQSRQYLDTAFQTSMMMADPGTLIVPDALVEGLKKEIAFLNLQYKDGVTDEQFVAAVEKVYPEESADESSTPYHTSLTKQLVYDQSTGIKTMISYLAIYIGLVFLITSAAVLALQQLSEASDNLERYGLLKRLGAEQRMIDHSLFVQIAIYFMLPLSLAVVHSAVGIYVANSLVAQFGHLDILGNTLITAVFFLVIYGGYFLTTYFGSRSMIHQRQN